MGDREADLLRAGIRCAVIGARSRSVSIRECVQTAVMAALEPDMTRRAPSSEAQDDADSVCDFLNSLMLDKLMPADRDAVLGDDLDEEEPRPLRVSA